MKRRLNIIQGLLQVVESEAANTGIKNKSLLAAFLGTQAGQYAQVEDVDYALSLCLDEGYLKPVKLTQNMDPGVQLTWKGHDFIDANRG